MSRQGGTVETYVQIFRNGSIEFCDTRLLRRGPQDGDQIPPERIPSTGFERKVLEGAKKALNVLATLNVPLPYVIFLTLADVQGYVMALPQHMWHLSDEVYPIDRERLYVPGQLVNSRGGQVDSILKPILDSVWNATGFAESPNFDDEGIWAPPRY